MKIRETITCPLELTHDIIKGKWKPDKRSTYLNFKSETIEI